MRSTCFARGETGDWALHPQKLLTKWDDESWDLVGTDEIESWVTPDLLKARASPSLSKIGMSASVMGCQCGIHARVCAPPTTSRSPCNDPFPRTRTIGDVHIDDFVNLSILHFSGVHVDSSPIEVQRADAMYGFLEMPTNAGKPGGTLSGEFSGRLDGISGTLGFPLESRVSLMLNRTLLQRILGEVGVCPRFAE